MSASKNVNLVLLLDGFQVVRMMELLRAFEMRGGYQRVGGCIETTSLMTSKTILINGVDVYETYTKEMVI